MREHISNPALRHLCVEVFDSDSGEFRCVGTARLAQRDPLLLEMGRYLETRASAKRQAGYDAEIEEGLIGDLRDRLDGKAA